MTVPSSMLGGQKGENRGKRKKKKGLVWVCSSLPVAWTERYGHSIVQVYAIGGSGCMLVL